MGYTDNFMKARLGSCVMVGCSACGYETGELVIKKRGKLSDPEYNGPRMLIAEDKLCEFCDALGKIRASGALEEGVKHGVFKIIEKKTRKLFAYVPFSEKDIANDPNVTLKGGGKAAMKHRMVILASQNDDEIEMESVDEEGV